MCEHLHDLQQQQLDMLRKVLRTLVDKFISNEHQHKRLDGRLNKAEDAATEVKKHLKQAPHV